MIRALPVRRLSVPFPLHGGKTEPVVEKHDPRSGTIYVRSSNLSPGPYSLDDLKQALACGRVLVTDRAWHKGLHTWIPLSAILDGSHGQISPTPSTEDSIDRFYQRVADSFHTAASELLESFVRLLGSLEKNSSRKQWDDALLKNLGRAGTFHKTCAEVLATTVRYLTPLDVVRRTPMQQLSDEIRRTGFGSAYNLVQTVLIEITTGETRSREQRFREYLTTVSQLPRTLVGYVTTKCYGTLADAEKQEACVRSCTVDCGRIVTRMLQLMENHPSSRATAAVSEVKQRNDQLRFTGCSVVGVLAFLAFILVPIAGDRLDIGSSGVLFLWVVVVAVILAVACYFYSALE